MKQLALFVALAVCMSISGKPQVKKKSSRIQTVTFIVNMSCENCKKKIENTLSWEKGVKDLQISLPQKTIFLQYDSRKTDTLRLRKAIEKLNYKASYPAKKSCCKQ